MTVANEIVNSGTLQPTAAKASSEASRRSEWLRASAAGMLFGSLIALGVLHGVLHGAPLTASPLLLGTVGLLQGGLLGLFQYRVLHRRLTRLASYAWVSLTAGAASLVWLAAGAAIDALSDRLPRPNASSATVAAVLGVTLLFGSFVGCVMGVAQGIALRRHVRDSWRLRLASVGGWIAATPFLSATVALTLLDCAWWQTLLFDIGLLSMAGAVLGSMTFTPVNTLEPWVDDQRWSLRGKTCAVTGANRGIGFEVAKGLARMGAQVVLFCRDKNAGTRAAARIRAAAPAADIVCIVLDLGSLESVRHAAHELRIKCTRLDVLIHNAGSVFPTRTLTGDGFEATLAVDALGPFLLTVSLLDLLEAAHGRVIHLAGIYQRRGELALDDLMFERREYDLMRVNAQAQLARVVLAAELARRCPRLLSVSVHPGAVWTSLPAAFVGTRIDTLRKLMRPVFVRAELGAQPVLRLAAEPIPSVPSGTFLHGFASTSDAPDPLLCDDFWTKCEALVREAGPAAARRTS